jgi:hypothetical protein
MTTCSRNLFKHLKICYQTKTGREMSQRGFYFFANLMIFFSKKMIKYSLFLINFSHLCKISNPKKKLIMTCVFEYFQSHCHILKELHEFLWVMGAITIFEKCIFIFSFVVMDWSQNQLGWVHIWGGGGENKMLKDECESFYNQIRMNHLT